MTIARTEHIEWCKKRAGAYLDMGDVSQAWASFGSDMQSQDETKDHPAIQIGFQMFFAGLLSTVSETRKFINGVR